MSYPIPRRQYTVTEYHQMIAAGVLTKEDRVELLNGEIVEMSPINPSHAAAVDRISRLFHRRAGDEVLVRGQNPVTLDDYSEPEPDLSIVVFRPDFYALSHPRPADVLLLIEVAESSGQKDRLTKQPAYAASGIREYWIVDLPQDLIEVCTQPVESVYQSIRQVARGGSLTPELLPGLTLRAEELLG